MMMMMIYVAVCADPTQQVGSSCQRADQYITRPMRATRACSCRPTLRVDIYFVRRSRPAHNNNRLPLAWRGWLSASITRPSRRLISTVPPAAASGSRSRALPVSRAIPAIIVDVRYSGALGWLAAAYCIRKTFDPPERPSPILAEVHRRVRQPNLNLTRALVSK